MEDSDSITLEGVFQSPLSQYLPDIVPKESHLAYFQALLPKKWPSKNVKPMCIHMAGTGDQVMLLLLLIKEIVYKYKLIIVKINFLYIVVLTMLFRYGYKL